jgi:hypothetical protein
MSGWGTPHARMNLARESAAIANGTTPVGWL